MQTAYIGPTAACCHHTRRVARRAGNTRGRHPRKRTARTPVGSTGQPCHTRNPRAKPFADVKYDAFVVMCPWPSCHDLSSSLWSSRWRGPRTASHQGASVAGVHRVAARIERIVRYRIPRASAPVACPTRSSPTVGVHVPTSCLSLCCNAASPTSQRTWWSPFCASWCRGKGPEQASA
jgi:hypothetical protein